MHEQARCGLSLGPERLHRLEVTADAEVPAGAADHDHRAGLGQLADTALEALRELGGDCVVGTGAIEDDPPDRTVSLRQHRGFGRIDRL
jgi:hypothetical protein